MEWHLCCLDCWADADPKRTVLPHPGTGPRPCCFCGETTEPLIRVRFDPHTAPCRGEHAADWAAVVLPVPAKPKAAARHANALTLKAEMAEALA